MKIGKVIVAGVALFAMICLAETAALPDDGWEAKRAAIKNRPRPLILNSDGNEVVYWKTNLPVTVENFTAQRLETYRGSQVSTVAYCPWSSGFGLMTTTRAGEFLDMPRCIPELQPACHNAAPILKAMGLDCLDMTADYCHTNGMEVFVSIRVNDTHDAGYFIPGTNPPRSYLFPKWKDAHPDCLFGSYSNKPPLCAWSAVDFENPTVRAYMKKFVTDFVENYDVDGIEYDFFRHGQLFKTVGWGAYATEAQLKLMTEFMMELRAITEAAGRKKGKPILVLVRTSDSLAYAKAQGIDVEAWLRRGVMDIWSVSDYFQLDYLRPNAELAHKYGVKFNSALAESRIPGSFGRLKKSNKRFAKAIMLPGRNTIASYAAEYSAAMAAGCDGISSFNLSCTGGINKRGLLDVDPRQTKDLDKVYFALVRGSGGYRPESWVKDGGRFYVRPRIDPATIFKIPAGKPYVFGIEFGDEDWANFDMVAKAALAGGQEVITELKVNGKTIAPGAFKDGVHAFALKPGDLKKGYNEFSVTVDSKFGKELTFHDFAVYLHKVKSKSCAADGVRHALDDAKIGLNCHPEYKGAAGTVAREGNGWRIHYDFSGGGHGLGMTVQPKEPIWARTIFFDAFHNDGHAMTILMTDSAGQTFRKVASAVPGAWRTFACDTRSGWGLHWGGPGDGVIRFPIRMFEINVDRFKKGVPDAQDVGDVRIRNIAYDEIPSAARAEIVRQQAASSGVRYTITDFSPGDRFSAGPRAFYRSGAGGGYALADGRLEVDFAREPRVALCNEISVWGLPEEFLLTVEAPAEAAGAEFELGIRVGKRLAFNSFGRLRPPVPGRKRIYQTLSMPGPCNALGWEEKKGAPGLARSKRVVQVVVKKGNAPAKRLDLRLVRLEAVVSGHTGVGIVVPPLLATPPAGSAPPRRLSVGYLNLEALPRGKGEIRVAMRDWEGRELGTGRAPVPVTPPGARAQVSVELPDVPSGLNFVSYDCTLFEDGRPVAGVPPENVCWTHPLADGGSPELRPDLPWGMGVYIHRSEDRYAYASGYASPTNAAALAQMEQRAALAQAAGIKWERAEIKPSQIAYAKGQYDFSYYDKMFEIAERHGLSCCGLLSHYWPVGYKPYTQACYDAYVETARRTAEHFKGRIRFWEVWNEPNIGFWTGPKEDYVKMADAVCRAIKSVDPEARVIACSTAGIDLKFIDMCIEKGMAFDELSIHPYRTRVEERRFLDELASVTNRAHGNPSWPTEMGWPTGCDNATCSERAQAGNYACAYMTAAGSGTIRAIFGYDFVDDGFNVLERENNFGIVRRDLTPKPAYRAVAKICRTFVKGTASLESAKLAKGEAWIFRMGGKSAVWATCPARLAVRTDSPATVTNLMDEETGRGQTLSVVSVGPQAPAFFDVNVLSVSSDGAAADAPDDGLVNF